MVYAAPNTGEPRGGDNLAYVRQEPGQHEFSKPITVNSIPGSVFRLVPAEMAVARDGRVHVSWAGSMGYVIEQSATRTRPAKMEDMKFMFYTRLNDDRTAFEEQRNVAGDSFGFEMAAAIVADSRGDVHLFWGGSSPGRPHEDAARRIFGVHSTDEGRTFSKSEPVWDAGKGVCVCCTIEALADKQGTLYMTYRSAEKNEARDTYLLVSKDKGKTFTGSVVDHWEINACPTSTYALAADPRGVLFGWETKGEVFLSRASARKPLRPTVPAREGWNRKFPFLAINSRGESIFVWAEGAHYRKGGDLAWQVFDARGNPTPEQGLVKDAVRAAGMPAAYAAPDGRFVILH
jgi:hypothetical protein